MFAVNVLTRVDEVLVRTFGTGPAGVGRRPERLARLAACVVVSLTGLGLVVPNLWPLVSAGSSPVVAVLSVVGTLVCVGLTAAGGLLYRSDFSTPNAVRIAGWNFLGLVVLGLVLLGHAVSRGSPGTFDAANVLAAGNVLAISAAAHVIIGVHDARRVRAEQLAREREKLAVLSRVLRHNLRNDATVLIGHADLLAEQLDDPSLLSVTGVLQERSRRLGTLADETKTMMAALDRLSTPASRTNVRTVVDAAVETVAPAADVAVDVDPDLWMWADHAVESALVELVENAVVHGQPPVRITAAVDDDRVRVRVADDGPGVPAAERSVVTGETDITQLDHGSGLGLWVARSVAEAAGGRLVFEDGGTVVTLVHDRADPPASAASGEGPATAA